jgi:hypothetical protein
VTDGAVHQIQKPNCAGPEHAVFLQENELGSALALKAIAGEAVRVAAVSDCESIGNAVVAPKTRTITIFRRVTITESPLGFDLDFISANCI